MKTRYSAWAMGALIAFFIPFIVLAQGTPVQPYRKLTANDFSGTPVQGAFAAYTYCYVSYTYYPTRRNGVYNVDFDVRLTLNSNKSWIKFEEMEDPKHLADVLTHEQGHYNMAWLMRNELYSVLSRHRYTANYQTEIADLFHTIDVKYHKMNEDYENQTEHMMNAAGQRKWNTWFNRQIGNMQIASNSSY